MLTRRFDTQPTALTEAALRDVVAGKPIDLLSKVDRTRRPGLVPRPEHPAGRQPAAIAHAILQRSDANLLAGP